jgi:hypothetical protein
MCCKRSRKLETVLYKQVVTNPTSIYLSSVDALSHVYLTVMIPFIIDCDEWTMALFPRCFRPLLIKSSHPEYQSLQLFEQHAEEHIPGCFLQTSQPLK